MNRDCLGFRVGRVPWSALAATATWLALAGYGQDGGAEPVGAAPAGDLKAAMAVDLGGGVSMEIVLVLPGSFQMGSETGDTDEKPVHKVTITRPFYLGRCEVTQAQWQAVMGACPSSNQGPDFPVTNVTWDDCRQFCQKLNESVGGALRAANGFRLPTEAEWEYACRAGTTTVFCFGDDGTGLGEYAWFDGNARDCLREVGTRKPNAWGLCDMHGNVWEWCSDWKGDYSAEAATDPPGPVHGVCRVCRGGSWVDVAGVFRSANRAGGAPGSRVGDIGLRVAFAPAVQQ